MGLPWRRWLLLLSREGGEYLWAHLWWYVCYSVPLGGCRAHTFEGGDIIGAGIDFSQNRAFFTKNGTLIGMAR
jgi:hypothetical protein